MKKNNIDNFKNIFNDFKYWNIVIVLLWIILYITGLLTIAKIKYFIIIIIIISLYKLLWKIIEKK